MRDLRKVGNRVILRRSLHSKERGREMENEKVSAAKYIIQEGAATASELAKLTPSDRETLYNWAREEAPNRVN